MKIYLYLFLGFMIFPACSSSELGDKIDMSKKELITRSTSENTLFLNVKNPDLREGQSVSAFYMSGDIYSAKRSTYEFVLGTNGHGGIAEISLGSGFRKFKAVSGSSIERVRITLQPGWNKAYIWYNGAYDGDYAEIRFVIDKINERQISSEDGFVDLALSGLCRIYDPTGSEVFHRLCQDCKFPNSKGATVCSNCGEEL